MQTTAAFANLQDKSTLPMKTPRLERTVTDENFLTDLSTLIRPLQSLNLNELQFVTLHYFTLITWPLIISHMYKHV